MNINASTSIREEGVRQNPSFAIKGEIVSMVATTKTEQFKLNRRRGPNNICIVNAA